MQNLLNNSLVILPTSRAIRDQLSKLQNKNQLIQKYISIGDFFGRSVIDKCKRKSLDKNLKILFYMLDLYILTKT